MEPKAKHLKLDKTSSKSEIEFLDLNDHCIADIFDKLSSADLCSMSFVCQRMQTLAFKHFLQKSPQNVLTIIAGKTSTRKKDLVTFSDSCNKHEKHFRKCIPNVRLLWRMFGTDNLIKVIKTECCPNLKVFDITAKVPMNQRHGESIKDQLKELDSLAIREIKAATDIHNVFLTHCKSLKQLTIETDEDGNADWLLEIYPKLQSLAVLFPDKEHYCRKFVRFANRFFNNHPNVNDVSCVGGQALKAILRNVTDIQRLSVHIQYDDNFVKVLGDLRDYCKKNPIQCLEFQLNDNATETNLKMLHDFNKIHEIHGLTAYLAIYRFNDIMPFIQQLKHLKMLKLRVAETRDLNKIPDILTKNLTRLEVVELEDISKSTNMVLKTVLMPFVSNATAMKKLTIIVGDTQKIKMDSNDLIELNAARLRASGARPMDIHVVKFSYGTFTEPKLNIPQKCMLRIKFEATC